MHFGHGVEGRYDLEQENVQKVVLERSSCETDLGVLMGDQLNWFLHVEGAASKVLGMLKITFKSSAFERAFTLR